MKVTITIKRRGPYYFQTTQIHGEDTPRMKDRGINRNHARGIIAWHEHNCTDEDRGQVISASTEDPITGAAVDQAVNFDDGHFSWTWERTYNDRQNEEVPI